MSNVISADFVMSEALWQKIKELQDQVKLERSFADIMSEAKQGVFQARKAAGHKWFDLCAHEVKQNAMIGAVLESLPFITILKVAQIAYPGAGYRNFDAEYQGVIIKCVLVTTIKGIEYGHLRFRFEDDLKFRVITSYSPRSFEELLAIVLQAITHE